MLQSRKCININTSVFWLSGIWYFPHYNVHVNHQPCSILWLYCLSCVLSQPPIDHLSWAAKFLIKCIKTHDFFLLICQWHFFTNEVIFLGTWTARLYMGGSGSAFHPLPCWQSTPTLASVCPCFIALACALLSAWLFLPCKISEYLPQFCILCHNAYAPVMKLYNGEWILLQQNYSLAHCSYQPVAHGESPLLLFCSSNLMWVEWSDMAQMILRIPATKDSLNIVF